MSIVSELVSELTATFRRHQDDKLAAHERSWPLLQQATREPGLLREAFEVYLAQPKALNQGSFPVVTICLAQNAHFGLVTNAWIPLPGRETHWSTTAVHHHGDMLLSTCTAFGPGYQHLYFDRPKRRSPDAELFDITLSEEASHPKHHVLFVDAWRAHCPLYPSEVVVTLALWSHRFPVTWRDHLKRLPFIQGREEPLRKLVRRLRLGKQLDLRQADYYDYFPTERGFQGMKVRQQIPRGPAPDHLRNVLSIMQATGNESLVPSVAARLGGVVDPEARRVGEELLGDLRRGRTIEGRFAPEQFRVPHMHFTRKDIERALATQRTTEDDRGRQLPAT